MKDLSNNNKYKYLNLAVSIILVLFVFAFIFVGMFMTNTKIDYEYIEIDLVPDKPEEEKTSVKIAHLSDTHFGNIEVDIAALIQRLAVEKPDIIAITGDITESNVNLYECGVLDFVEKLVQISHVFYVNGNHEKAYPSCKKMYYEMQQRGVITLFNQNVNITVSDKDITILGLYDNANYFPELLNDNPEAVNNPIIMLAHHPEKFPSYSSLSHTFRPNLILSGHAHGGQFRIPDAIYAPHQGFFPKYTSGLYKSDDNKCFMVVSRGVGNSSFPIRLSNPPHVPLITVKI